MATAPTPPIDVAALPPYASGAAPFAREGPRLTLTRGADRRVAVTIDRRLRWLDWFERQAANRRAAWKGRLHAIDTPVRYGGAAIAVRVNLDEPALRRALSGYVARGPSALAVRADGSATLRIRWARPIEVEVTARAWSATRADLVLMPAGRRLRYPRRWYEAGFAALFELRRGLKQPPLEEADQAFFGGR